MKRILILLIVLFCSCSSNTKPYRVQSMKYQNIDVVYLDSNMRVGDTILYNYEFRIIIP